MSEPLDVLLEAMAKVWARPEVAALWGLREVYVPGSRERGTLFPSLLIMYRPKTRDADFITPDGLPGPLLDESRADSEVSRIERAARNAMPPGWHNAAASCVECASAGGSRCSACLSVLPAVLYMRYNGAQQLQPAGSSVL